MNVVMILSTPLPPTEGIGFYCTSLARELVRNGHGVTLVTRGARVREDSRHPDGYRVIRAPFVPVYPLHVHLHGAFVQRIVEELEATTDVFHLHSPLVPPVRTRRPVVATVHTPIMADVRSLEMVGAVAYLAKAQGPVSIALERSLLRRADRVTAVARSVASELGEYGLEEEAVTVVGNGTDATFFAPDDREERPAERSLLYAGRLAHRKGLLDLLEAFRALVEALPDVVLKLAGTGPLSMELSRRAETAGVAARVELLGHIRDREALRTLYQDASVYVQPSHYEGLPTSVLEAMSCGCPIVATAVSGHLDAITDRVDGRLVAPKQPEALAGAIAQILNNPSQADMLGAHARNTVLAKFTWPVIARKFVKVYHEALG